MCFKPKNLKVTDCKHLRPVIRIGVSFNGPLGNTTGDGKDATPSCGAVPGAMFPRRVHTASAGDGEAGQQPGRSAGEYPWPPSHPQAIPAGGHSAGSGLPAFT